MHRKKKRLLTSKTQTLGRIYIYILLTISGALSATPYSDILALSYIPHIHYIPHPSHQTSIFQARKSTIISRLIREDQSTRISPLQLLCLPTPQGQPFLHLKNIDIVLFNIRIPTLARLETSIKSIAKDQVPKQQGKSL